MCVQLCGKACWEVIVLLWHPERCLVMLVLRVAVITITWSGWCFCSIICSICIEKLDQPINEFQDYCWFCCSYWNVPLFFLVTSYWFAFWGLRGALFTFRPVHTYFVWTCFTSKQACVFLSTTCFGIWLDHHAGSLSNYHCTSGVATWCV